jgi:hypothetical protein
MGRKRVVGMDGGVMLGLGIRIMGDGGIVTVSRNARARAAVATGGGSRISLVAMALLGSSRVGPSQ